MYIEIQKDVVQDAIEKRELDVNESMDFLIQMALCARQGKHIVSVPCLVSQTFQNDLSEVIGKGYVSSLNYFNQKRYSYGIYIDHLLVKCYISYTYDENLPSEIIQISPQLYCRLEPWVETYILTENLVDSAFYIHCAYYFANNVILNGRKNDHSFTFCFYPLMGGGATIDTVMKNEIEKGQHFCLSLVDSDKKYDGDTMIGETAYKLVELVKKENPLTCKVYVMEKVREIENLIPRMFVEEFGDNTGFIHIFDLNPSFFDMKVGLSLGELYDENVCDYWKSILNEPELFEERDNIVQHCTAKKEYDSQIKRKAPLKKGFGSGLLSLVIGDIDFSREMKKYNPRMIDALYNIKPDDLTANQNEEWLKIGRQMFSWTCCLKVKF